MIRRKVDLVNNINNEKVTMAKKISLIIIIIVIINIIPNNIIFITLRNH